MNAETTVTFVNAATVGINTGPSKRLDRQRFHAGDTLTGIARAHVIAPEKQILPPVEVLDLKTADGTTYLDIPYYAIRVCDEEEVSV